MSSVDILTMCLRNLFKRKLRTILTMLGVVIGTVAIVVTISLGLAVDLRFQQRIDEMGNVTVITVQSGANRWMPPGEDEVQTEFPDLDDAAVQKFQRIPGVDLVLPAMQMSLGFRSGNYVAWTQVVGVRPEAFAALGYQMEEGRPIAEGNSLEVVFGSFAEINFQDMTTDEWVDRWWPAWMGEDVEPFVDIFNDRIQTSYDDRFIWGFEQDQDLAFGDGEAARPIRPFTLEVVGLMERTGDWNVDQSVFMDIEFVRRMRADQQRHQQQWGMSGLETEYGMGRIDAGANVFRDIGYDFIYVRANDINLLADIHEQIEEMGYMGFYPTMGIEMVQDMVAGQQQMLGAIGAVSLFVAAIGIANTMVMSTYERTREIGVMKVIGAALADIKKLFLMEAAMIGFFGGIFGILFSYLVSYILNNHLGFALMGGMMDWMMGEDDAALVSLITPWLSGAALIFASFIGLVSGYYPAQRATKLSALNAIRTE